MKSPQTINVTVVDVNTGRKRYGWTRNELKVNLRIPESTLKRYLSLLATHATAEFGYVSRQRSFTHYQIHALKTLREWFTYLSQAEIIKRLENEGIPDDDQQETA